jgi:putative iron-dependent peroxidase
MNQPGILADVPRTARYLTFDLVPNGDIAGALDALRHLADGENTVVGIGLATVVALGKTIEGLREHPPLVGPGAMMPSTPAALWMWLRGSDRGEVLHQSHALAEAVEDGFELTDITESFQYRDSRDLSGYVDGTENPEGEKAQGAAVCEDGSSFVSVQRWLHDLPRFQGLEQPEQDDVFGRRLSDNEEFAEAPESAHVKRTAQEDFSPEAFIVRRSMPWSSPDGEGLVFVAFANTLDKFEAISRRMVGLDDGITDGLFRFTRALTTSSFWCPPVQDGLLNLERLGL